MNQFDTVAAISTPPGTGGIAIVRMSGAHAVEIADRVFQKQSGQPLKAARTHTIHYGHVYAEDGTVIDEVLVSVMRAPNTYTREDVVEINCHGSAYAANRLLEALLKNGASLAPAGEFTRRAFLNGRIDLAKAEAVMDVITSKTALAHAVSVGQLSGRLSGEIDRLRADLLGLTAHLHAVTDFPEEGLEPLSDAQFIEILEGVQSQIGTLLKTADTGKLIREGVPTAIVGKPNVGKSSLLNLLAGEDRAIVTDIAGTTRDVIEECVNLDGILLNVSDTAGIRETGDRVERMGVERTKHCLEQAALVLFLLDGSAPPDADDMQIAELLADKRVIVLLNKSDLGIHAKAGEFCRPFQTVIPFSVKTQAGFSELKQAVKDLLGMAHADELANSSAVVNLRHKEALIKASLSVRTALDTAHAGLPLDLTFVDMENALSALGEITGQTVGEEIVNQIFASFCVGK